VSSDEDSDNLATVKSSRRFAAKQKSPSPSISSDSYSESADNMSDTESKSSTENNNQVGSRSFWLNENYCGWKLTVTNVIVIATLLAYILKLIQKYYTVECFIL